MKCNIFGLPLSNCKTLNPQSSTFYCLLSVLTLFFVYNLTICPTIYWRDSPEFVNTAFSFGIAHPAGFPVYSTISKIFTFIPISNLAMRVNYVSLFFGVSTGWLIYFIIIRLINICYSPITNSHAYYSAMLGVLLMGGASSFWWMSVITEVYTMNCFFLSVFFLIILKWYESKEPRFIFLASFSFGFAIAVYGANLLFIPLVIVFYFFVEDKKSLKRFLIICGLFLLGYSIHIYLPIRSLSNPPFDWGNPETLEQFIIHVTDRKDKGQHFNEIKNLSSIFSNFKNLIHMIIRETTLVGFFLIVVGSACHYKKSKRSFFLLASIGFVNTLFFMTTLHQIAKNGSLFLSSFIIFSYWIGLGIYFLLVESSGYLRAFNYRRLVIAVVVFFIIFSFANDYSYNDKSSFYLSRDNPKEMYASLDQNALIFVISYWFNSRYFKDLENLRPDISIVPISEIVRPSLVNKVTTGRYPLIDLPSIDSTRENQHDFFQSLISKNVNNRPVYSEFKRRLTKYNYQYLIPGNKFLMRVTGHKVDRISDEVLNEYAMKFKESLSRELSDKSFFLDQEMGVRSNYETFLTNFADYLMIRNRHSKAIPFLKLAESIVNPEYTEVPMMLAICYFNLKKFDKAEKIFLELNKKKKDYQNNFFLASIYYEKGDYEKALQYLDNSIKLNKDFLKSYFLLGLIYFEKGDYEESIKNINYAINKTKFIPDKTRMQNTLKHIKISRDNNKGMKIKQGENREFIYPGSPAIVNTKEID